MIYIETICGRLEPHDDEIRSHIALGSNKNGMGRRIPYYSILKAYAIYQSQKRVFKVFENRSNIIKSERSSHYKQVSINVIFTMASRPFKH